MKSENELITRRATVDDIPELVRLWDNFSYPSDIFEKRLTEFHLVENPHSKQILAAIGVRFQDQSVLIHSEAFGDNSNADLYRDMLWTRFLALAKNLGASCIWTQESASFWHKIGFRPAPPDKLEALPNFPKTESSPHWFYLQLFDDEQLKKANLVLNQHKIDESEIFDRQLKILKNIILFFAFSIIATLLIMFLYSYASSYPILKK